MAAVQVSDVELICSVSAVWNDYKALLWPPTYRFTGVLIRGALTTIRPREHQTGNWSDVVIVNRICVVLCYFWDFKLSILKVTTNENYKMWTYLVPAKVVDEYHANEDNQQAEALEGKHGQAEGAVLSCHTGGVVLAVGTALLAWQAVAGWPLVCIGTAVCSFPLPPHPCEKQDREIKEFNLWYLWQQISETNPVIVLSWLTSLSTLHRSLLRSRDS